MRIVRSGVGIMHEGVCQQQYCAVLSSVFTELAAAWWRQSLDMTHALARVYIERRDGNGVVCMKLECLKGAHFSSEWRQVYSMVNGRSRAGKSLNVNTSLPLPFHTFSV